MKIACVGGGPAGLFFAALVKQAIPSLEIVVYERNRPDDTFGFGVVFSDATLATLAAADPVLADRLESRGEHWDHISVRLKGELLTCGGNGMAAITRKELLLLLTERAVEAGVDIRWQHDVRSLHEVIDADLVVASDGANSRIRTERSAGFEPQIDTARAKFIWFGTKYRFEGLTFLFQRGPHGTFAVHGYPISPTLGTFIVETDEASWRRAGLDRFDTSQPSGPSDTFSKDYLEKLFAGQIEGHELVMNNSRWGNFRTIRNRQWHCDKVVLIGDAAHTAHFSVGSGTKMAMEDAAALADQVLLHPTDLRRALEGYESYRRPRVERIQEAAGPSLSWWEHFGEYYQTLPPTQFAFHFLTRAIGHDRIRARDPEFVARVHQWWEGDQGGVDPLSSETVLDGVGPVPRRADVRDLDGTGIVARFSDRVTVPLLRTLPVGEGTNPWGMLLTPGEADPRLPPRGPLRPALVAVVGGSATDRAAMVERVRLRSKVPTMVVEDEFSEDRALTMILSGRADIVGVREAEVGAAS
jgi:anthraniloyl-CoA monooxygenase